MILDPKLAHKEVSLRIELILGFELFQECRIELGHKLFDYRTLYKPLRLWTKLAEKLGSHIGRTSRTIFRLVDEYEESVNGKKPRTLPPTSPGPDGPDDGGSMQMSEEEVDFLEARRLIREAVAPWEGREKIAVLKQAIKEEAHVSWGMREHFTLEIKPCLPLIMVTGEELVEPEQAAA